MRAPPSPRSMSVEEPATCGGKDLSSAANGSVGSSSTTTARLHERFPHKVSDEDERRRRRYSQKILNSSGSFRQVRWPCDEWPTTSSIPPCTGECKRWASGRSFSVRESTRNYSRWSTSPTSARLRNWRPKQPWTVCVRHFLACCLTHERTIQPAPRRGGQTCWQLL